MVAITPSTRATRRGSAAAPAARCRNSRARKFHAACYSTDIPAALIGAPFFSISGPMMLSKYSVVRFSGGTT